MHYLVGLIDKNSPLEINQIIFFVFYLLDHIFRKSGQMSYTEESLNKVRQRIIRVLSSLNSSKTKKKVKFSIGNDSDDSDSNQHLDSNQTESNDGEIFKSKIFESIKRT